jgi:hypothetical protein
MWGGEPARSSGPQVEPSHLLGSTFGGLNGVSGGSVDSQRAGRLLRGLPPQGMSLRFRRSRPIRPCHTSK